MRDRREEILTRLLAICKAQKGVEATYRNVDDVTELLRPAIVLKDGAEIASDRNEKAARKAISNVIDLHPEIWLLAGGDEKTMPSALATLRLRLISAITLDATLGSITGEEGNIRYLGCDLRDQYGVLLNGAMIMRWQISYPLTLTDLA